MAYGFQIKLHGVLSYTHLPVLNTSSSVSLIRSSVNNGPSYTDINKQKGLERGEDTTVSFKYGGSYEPALLEHTQVHQFPTLLSSELGGGRLGVV